MSEWSFSRHARRFIEAVLADELDEAEALLRTHPELIAERNHRQETPLHWLAVENQLEGVRLLLRHGADPNTIDDYGSSVLMDVAGLGLSEVASILIQAGADVRFTQRSTSETALHTAAAHSPVGGIIDVLVDAGGDVNAQDTIICSSPLHQAAAYRNAATLPRLLARGANPNLLDDCYGVAVARLPEDADVTLLAMLVEAGTDLTTVDTAGTTLRERLATESPAWRAWLERRP